jgi:SAM-dependent methyltransferase
MLRARVLARCEEFFPAGGRVLDLGCGPGLDSRALGALGFTVVAIDASAGMVAEARAAGVDARVLPAERVAELDGIFDGVLSDFGALNCVDLDLTFAGLRARTREGSVVIAVVMGPFCAAETLALLARGRLRAAWTRRRVREVPLEGGRVPVAWLRARDLAGRGFTIERVEALGLLVAPPDLGGLPGRRSDAEPLVARLPVLREWGDHTLVVLRREG